MTDATTEQFFRGAVGLQAQPVEADEEYIQAVLSTWRVMAFAAPFEIPDVFSAPIGGATMPLSEMKARLAEAVAGEQRRLAESFAEQTSDLYAGAQIWAHYGPPFVVTVVTEEELDLEDELALHTLFANLVRRLETDADLMLRSTAEVEHGVIDLGQHIA